MPALSAAEEIKVAAGTATEERSSPICPCSTAYARATARNPSSRLHDSLGLQHLHYIHGALWSNNRLRARCATALLARATESGCVGHRRGNGTRPSYSGTPGIAELRQAQPLSTNRCRERATALTRALCDSAHT